MARWRGGAGPGVEGAPLIRRIPPFLLLLFVGCSDSCSRQSARVAPPQATIDLRSDAPAPPDMTRDLGPPPVPKIVVLGSSTAFGMGPLEVSNTWVNRYRRYLSQTYPGLIVDNLAEPGYTTYHIQPSGDEPPAGRPAPDSTKNITAALGLGPVAIIINLPSNDQANDYGAWEQAANYKRVVARAATPLRRRPPWAPPWRSARNNWRLFRARRCGDSWRRSGRGSAGRASGPWHRRHRRASG
jgi:hypothetical protein